MENIVTRSEHIKTITDFMNYSSNNGTFVRIVGEDERLLAEISKMDTELSLSAISGKLSYKRIQALPNISDPKDVEFYTECYNDWIRCGRRRILSKCTLRSDKADEKLSSAVNEVTRQLRVLKPMLTDSMEKNAVIKLLYRFDEVMKGFSDRKGFYDCAKLVSDNVTKEQDYLFFYMLSLMGVNVLLIQNRSDIDIYQKQLKISACTVTGHLGGSQIPLYREPLALQNNQPAVQQRPQQTVSTRLAPETTRSNPTVRVNIPPRPPKNRPVQSIPQSPPVRSTPVITPTVRTAPQTQDNRGNIRVTIPPRPDRKRNTVPQPTQPQRNTPMPNYPQNTVQVPQPTQSQRNTPMPNYPQNTVRIPPAQQSVRGIIPPQVQPIRNTPMQNNQPVMSTGRELSYEQLAGLAVSIVQILVFKGSHNFNRQPDTSGSGIMIGEQGYILTNCHVTDCGRLYGVRVENDSNIYYTDRLIKYHRDLDLAVLRIDRRLDPLPVFKGQGGLSRGQRVVAIGSPMGLFNTVSDGIISGFREIDGVNMIQFTAPISPGSSGGAVLNMFGEVIGISTAGLKYGQNINLAVPYDAINMFCSNFM